MATFTDTTPALTYGNLLQVPNNNLGLSSSPITVQDGLGNSTTLALSLSSVTINGNTYPTNVGAAGSVIINNGSGTLSWGTPTIDAAHVADLATATVTFSNKSGNISQWTNDSGYLITGDQLVFKTIAVSGQSDVVAGTTTDTLTLVAGSNMILTTNAGTKTVTIASTGGSGLVDGSYGDITISGVGTVMTIPTSTVTYAKMQDVSATNKVLGRVSSGAGVVEEISCTITPGAVLSGSNTGDQTNISGNAATVTTNANLTGPITSAGNATSVAAQTGTGSTFVMNTSPTLVTPVLGVAAATSINKVALTAPATGSTLTIADGQTLTVNGSATITNGTHSGTNTGDQTNVTGSSGSCTGNAATATALQNARTIGGVSFDGTANIVPNTITIASSSTNATYYIPFFTSSSGALQPTIDTDITYNPSTNTLTVPTVVAALTGNASTVTTNANLGGPITSVGNTTSIASQTGTGTKFVVDTSPTLVTPVLGVASATSVNKVAITAPATGSTLTIADGTTLTVNGNTTLTNGTHSGTNTGDQNLFSTVAVSGQSNVVADSTSDTLTLVAGTNVTITTNATTDSITISSTGGSGLADGDYGDVTVSASSTVLTVDSVTVADAAGDSTTWPMLSRSVTGSNQVVSTDPGLTYDASANSLATTTFVGALTGNVTGNVSGSSGSCTGNSATVTTNANLTGEVTSTGNAAVVDKTAITNRSADATPDPSADYVMTYDASATALKKVLLENVGGWVKISSQTASSSATIDFTTLSTLYRDFRIVLSHVIPATDTADFWIRTSTDGGSTYDSGGTDYEHTRDAFHTGGTSVISGSAGDTKIVLLGSLGNNTREEISGEIRLHDPQAALGGAITWQICGKISSGAFYNCTGAGLRDAAANVDAIRFMMSTGNISSGTFTLYGLVA